MEALVMGNRTFNNGDGDKGGGSTKRNGEEKMDVVVHRASAEVVRKERVVDALQNHLILLAFFVGAQVSYGTIPYLCTILSRYYLLLHAKE